MDVPGLFLIITLLLIAAAICIPQIQQRSGSRE
jgi:hypothetical protein